MSKTFQRCTILTAFLLAGCTPPIVTEEPAAGKLRTGEIIYVDDGSCPAGQVKEVTGGTPTQERGRRCVPRPE